MEMIENVTIRGAETMRRRGLDWFALTKTGTGAIHTNPLCPNVVYSLVSGGTTEAASLEELAKLVSYPYRIKRLRWCYSCYRKGAGSGSWLT